MHSMTILCNFISKAKVLQKGEKKNNNHNLHHNIPAFLCVTFQQTKHFFFTHFHREAETYFFFFRRCFSSLFFFFFFFLYKSDFCNDSMQILNSTMLTDRNSGPTGRLSTKSRNKRSQFPMQVIKILRGYLQYEKCTKWPFTQ